MTRDDPDDLTDLIERLIGFVRNERVKSYNEGLDVGKGMLKLDEPKSADDKFIEACRGHGFYEAAAEQTLGIIKFAGLKIVESDK